MPLSAKLQNLQTGDWVMLRHGGLERSIELPGTCASMARLRVRAFRRRRKAFPNKTYVRLQAGSTGILPLQSHKHCLPCPEAFNILDDGTPCVLVCGPGCSNLGSIQFFEIEK